MANATDADRIREIDQGIESAERFENDVLSSGEFNDAEKTRILSASEQELTQILESRGFRDTQGLLQARLDYFVYRDTDVPKAPTQTSEKEEEGAINPAEAAGVLLGLGLAPFIQNQKLTPEILEASSREYAEKAASEWNKTKDYSKAKSYFHAYERAQQDYFDRFAYTDPKAAKKLASFRTQKFIDRAILRNKLLKKEGIKGFSPRTFTPNYEKEAENRLRMIDKLSEMKAKDPSTTKDLEREKLLRAFADDDPVTFQHHINSQREQGKTIDPLMAKVIADKIEREAKTKSVLERSQRRQDQKTPKPTEPPKKQGRFARTKSRLASFGPRSVARRTKGKIMGSRLGKRIAGSKLGRLAGKANRFRDKTFGLKKKIKSSILNLLTKLLRRVLIGGVIGAISSFISGTIGAFIGIGTALATALAFIIAKITAGLTAAIGSLLAFSLASLATFIAAISVVGIIILIIIVVWQSIFPSSDRSRYPGITYTITGPERIENGEFIKNQIALFYYSDAICPIQNITLKDELPPGSTFISASGNPVDNLPPGEVLWKLSENYPTSEGSDVKTYIFDVVHKPQDDKIATSTASLEGCDTGQLEHPDTDIPDEGLYAGQDESPSDDPCRDNPYEKFTRAIKTDFGSKGIVAANFGDPLCNFGSHKLRQVIEDAETDEHVDQRYADFWLDIAQCETQFNPTDYHRSSYPGDSDQMGNWGLFQMRRSFPKPFKPWDPDKLDRGDLTWQRQVQNAINYNNNVLGGDFTYWGTARRLCYFNSYKRQPYCKKIIDARKQINPNTPPVNNCVLDKEFAPDSR